MEHQETQAKPNLFSNTSKPIAGIKRKRYGKEAEDALNEATSHAKKTESNIANLLSSTSQRSRRTTDRILIAKRKAKKERRKAAKRAARDQEGDRMKDDENKKDDSTSENKEAKEEEEIKKLQPPTKKKKLSKKEKLKLKMTKVTQKRKFSKMEDEPEKNERTLFVSNIPFKGTDTDKALRRKLKSHFGGARRVESVRLRDIPIAEKGKMYRDIKVRKKMYSIKDNEKTEIKAYIVFLDKSSVDKIVKDTKEETLEAPLKVRSFLGSRLQFDIVTGREKEITKDDHLCTVFIGNIPYDATTDELYQALVDHLECPVDNIRLVRDRTNNQSKGFAYVRFASRALASIAKQSDKRKMAFRESTLHIRRDDRLAAAKLKEKRNSQKSKAKDRRKKRQDASRQKVFQDPDQWKQQLRRGPAWQGVQSMQKKKTQKPQIMRR